MRYLSEFFYTDNYDYLKKYIIELFNNGKYHDVILYSNKYLEYSSKDMKINFILSYSYCQLGYFNINKNLIMDNLYELIELFLNKRIEIDINCLFKIFIYYEIKLYSLDLYIESFIRNYSDNLYFSIYLCFIRYIDNHEKDNLQNLQFKISNIDNDKYFTENINNLIKEEEQEKLFIPEKIYKNIYHDKDLSIVCYYEKNIMGSCNLVSKRNNHILIDCGSMIIDDKEYKINVRDFLNANNLIINDINAVLITHAHLDHYGSLNYFYNSNIPIYMTKETFELIEIVQNTIDLTKLNIKLINCQENFEIGNFMIKPIKNGHILGSVSYQLTIDEMTILCSGDLSIESQNTVDGFDFNSLSSKIDILLCESTYGNRKYNLSRKDNEILLSILLRDAYLCKINVFIPAFAIGRTQELIAIKNKFNIEGILYIDGLSKKVTRLYDRIKPNLKLYNLNIVEIQTIENNNFINSNKIIVASSGMLSKQSTFYNKYFNEIMESKCIVIQSGFVEYGNYALKMISNNYNVNLFSISLSAHANYENLRKFIDRIGPEILITNHGEGIAF